MILIPVSSKHLKKKPMHFTGAYIIIGRCLTFMDDCSSLSTEKDQKTILIMTIMCDYVFFDGCLSQ